MFLFPPNQQNYMKVISDQVTIIKKALLFKTCTSIDCGETTKMCHLNVAGGSHFGSALPPFFSKGGSGVSFAEGDDKGGIEAPFLALIMSATSTLQAQSLRSETSRAREVCLETSSISRSSSVVVARTAAHVISYSVQRLSAQQTVATADRSNLLFPRKEPPPTQHSTTPPPPHTHTHTHTHTPERGPAGYLLC